MREDPASLVVATVSYEAGAEFLTADQDAVLFGRGEDCRVRVGHQPLADLGVPRLAGQLVVIGGRRVGVENLSAQVAFDIKAPDGPLEAVRPGALYAPPEDRFEIRVAGSLATYTVLVHIPARQTMLRPRRPAAATIGPSTRFEVELTGRQWQILAAYGDPLRAGRTVPATHAEVADRVGWSMATVRVECSEIWSSFALAGIPMRDFPDKRDAIVDATLRHCVSRADKNGSP